MNQRHRDSPAASAAGSDPRSDWGDDLEPLRDRLRVLGQAERSTPPPPELEAVVMRAWDEHHAPVRSRVVGWLGVAAAAAALVAVVYAARYDNAAATVATTPQAGTTAAVAAAAPPQEEHSQPAAPASGGGRARVARRAVAQSPAAPPESLTAIVLVGGPPMPGERIQVVRTRIARDVLTTMGVRPVVAEGDMIDIDMLIGEDGVARGVRVDTLAQ